VRALPPTQRRHHDHYYGQTGDYGHVAQNETGQSETACEQAGSEEARETGCEERDRDKTETSEAERRADHG
jgi:hypothetical protein